jgi:hypothetical protein
MNATKDNFFKPEKLSAQAKSEQTTTIARDILNKEVSDRQLKTEKLRALRLAQPAAETPPKKTKASRKA